MAKAPDKSVQDDGRSRAPPSASTAASDPHPGTASGGAWIALGLIGVAGGIVHRSSGAIAIGTLLAVLPFAVYLILRHAIRATTFIRVLPESAFEGDDVEVLIELRNRSRVPLFQPVVTDMFSPELHATKRVLFTERVRPGEDAEQSYRATCVLPRGIYLVGPLTMTITDPFGWFRIRHTQTEKARIKVYPAVQALDDADDIGRALARFASELTRGGPGESDEFFSVRDYRRGDPLRRIHWGLTARRGSPVVREFTRNSAGDLTIIIDRNRDGLLGIGRGSSMEHAVKIAAALSSRALSTGHRVQVIAGEDAQDGVAPGSGRDYLLPILELLVRIRPNGDTPIAGLMREHRGRIAPCSTAVVMLSPYVSRDRALFDELESMRRRGVRVLAVVFDSTSFRQLWTEPGGVDTSAEFARKLEARGIRALTLPCSADLRAVFAGEAV